MAINSILRKHKQSGNKYVEDKEALSECKNKDIEIFIKCPICGTINQVNKNNFHGNGGEEEDWGSWFNCKVTFDCSSCERQIDADVAENC